MLSRRSLAILSHLVSFPKLSFNETGTLLCKNINCNSTPLIQNCLVFRAFSFFLSREARGHLLMVWCWILWAAFFVQFLPVRDRRESVFFRILRYLIWSYRFYLGRGDDFSCVAAALVLILAFLWRFLFIYLAQSCQNLDLFLAHCIDRHSLSVISVHFKAIWRLWRLNWSHRSR